MPDSIRAIRLGIVAVGIVATATLTACADVPAMKFTYYLPKASATLTLTQTLACNKAQSQLISAESVDVNVIYSRDPQRRHVLELSDLDGKFADLDLKFDLLDDGRLKDVNTQFTGEGETIAASAIQLATTAATVAAAAPARASLAAIAPAPAKAAPAPKPAEPCAILAQWTDPDKPTTLTYSKPAGDLLSPQAFRFEVSDISPDGQALAKALGPYRPVVTVVAASAVPIDGPSSDKATTIPQLAVTKVATVHLAAQVASIPAGGIAQPFWTRDVIVPVAGESYLTIGKGAAFGNQTFEMATTDAGALSMLHYTKKTGTGSAINAANGALTALQPKSAADQAAALNAQSDLIVAQQRLVKCKADPTNCS